MAERREAGLWHLSSITPQSLALGGPVGLTWDYFSGKHRVPRICVLVACLHSGSVALACKGLHVLTESSVQPLLQALVHYWSGISYVPSLMSALVHPWEAVNLWVACQLAAWLAVPSGHLLLEFWCVPGVTLCMSSKEHGYECELQSQNGQFESKTCDLVAQTLGFF